MNGKWLVRTATHLLTNIVVAYLLVLVQTAGQMDLLLLAKTILAIKLNIFALPLANTPVLDLAGWMWYVVVVMWISQWMHLSSHSISDSIEQVDDYDLTLRQMGAVALFVCLITGGVMGVLMLYSDAPYTTGDDSIQKGVDKVENQTNQTQQRLNNTTRTVAENQTVDCEYDYMNNTTVCESNTTGALASGAL